ncbi:MAG: anhydro-N-acetylmuramic acid kinase [Proteobacteria bacterium]|nr:anhydro-N-acetylmuramic acid kinase [Pseudomonadota bacterium]
MTAAADDCLFLGLMSGTSVDGIDAGLVRFHGDGAQARPELVFGRTYPWQETMRTRLVVLGQRAAALTLEAIGELETAIGLAFANAARMALQDSGFAPAAVTAIGAHGQTLAHRPTGALPFTLQLGDANLIAEHTGIAVIADFRRRDVAAGGHGAPLVPAFHAAILRDAGEQRAVLNLGGIANFTLLPAQGPVRGFDTGPANALLDAWCLRHTGQPFDAGGAFAAQGHVNSALLARLLGEPWFDLPPPKSTGRDQFHLEWVEAALTGAEAPADIQATLLALTARSVADALARTQPDTRRVIVCGGGVHNPVLLAALAEAMPEAVVESSAVHGLNPDFVEAMAFAWLAREHLAGRPGNLPTVTGAAGPRVLGALYPA